MSTSKGHVKNAPSKRNDCQELLTERGMNLIVIWIAVIGPYVAYLVIWSIVWLIKSTVLFMRTIGYVVDVSHLADVHAWGGIDGDCFHAAVAAALAAYTGIFHR